MAASTSRKTSTQVRRTLALDSRNHPSKTGCHLVPLVGANNLSFVHTTSWEDVEKHPDHVILSEAKDLYLLVPREVLQMLRCAKHGNHPFSASSQSHLSVQRFSPSPKLRKYSRNSRRPPITDVNAEKAGPNGKVVSAQTERREARMRALHQMVPIFFLVQFVVVLVALVAAMLWADPQFSYPTGKSSRRVMRRINTDLHD